MDKATQRAAERAANKLLAAAGCDANGLTLQAMERRRMAKKRARAAESRGREKAAKKAKRARPG
jgi:hypothetical protein